MTPESTCYNCKFWKYFASDHGKCHRFPPQVIPNINTNLREHYAGSFGEVQSEPETYWPTTGGDEQCGEWALNPEKLPPGPAYTR
jgi:hypothetical protein